MATVTPVYNWPVPTSTDYVKDGATSIEALGDAIDASLNSITAGKNVGLVPLNRTTFTSQTSVSVNNVFSATYTNYRIVFNANMSVNTNLSLRFRNAGSDITSANYFWHFASSNSGGSGYGSAGFGNSQTSFIMTQADVASICSASFDVFNPFVALNKRFNGIVTYGTSANHQGGQAFCGINTTATYDGFTIFMPTGNITGNITVYGYRD